MKLTYVLAAAALILAPHARAEQPKPLVTKVNNSGFVTPAYVTFESCELFTDRMVITHRFGGDEVTSMKTVEVRPLAITGLETMVQKAMSEKLESIPNPMCDGPSTRTVAGDDLVLFDNGGCGSPAQERKGGASHALMAIVDSFCPRMKNL